MIHREAGNGVVGVRLRDRILFWTMIIASVTLFLLAALVWSRADIKEAATR
jgi:hypothetical protein